MLVQYQTDYDPLETVPYLKKLDYISGQGPPFVSNILKYWFFQGGSVEVVQLRWSN